MATLPDLKKIVALANDLWSDDQSETRWKMIGQAVERELAPKKRGRPEASLGQDLEIARAVERRKKSGEPYSDETGLFSAVVAELGSKVGITDARSMRRRYENLKKRLFS